MKSDVEEIWRHCDGADGLVSNFGNVKKPSGKLVKHRSDKNGYRICELKSDGRWRTFKVHRLVAAAFIDTTVSASLHVNHKNGDKSDNRADNLEWVTVSENHFHKCRTLGLAAGENQYKAKLTNQQVQQIREMFFKKQIDLDGIANRFRICIGAASNVVSGKSYRLAGGPVVTCASYHRKRPGRTQQTAITNDKLFKIKQHLASGWSLAKIARFVGCSPKTVSNIRDKKVNYAI
jgi:AraC-like DNA-binding protein